MGLFGMGPALGGGMHERIGTVRSAWSSAVVCACLLGSAGCSSVERETLDRATPHDSTAWTSPSDCRDLLADRKAASRPPRLGTWNIRYFPDSVEGEQTDPDEATDVAWLACAIASLDVDILVVQEFKNSEVGLAKQHELLNDLSELTGGDWQLELDQCSPADVQHPGFLFDASRVQGAEFRELPSLNPDPVCSNSVSPGFAGYFSITDGPDFHLIAVHGASGLNAEQFDKRALTAAALEDVANDAIAINDDSDVLFAGDFNTGGCEECDPVTSNDDEVAALTETVAGFEPSLALLPTTETCSRVDDAGSLIDHVLATGSMAEVPRGSKVHVSGICEETSCGRQKNWLEDAYDRLSDHCPLILDLAAADDDSRSL